MKKYLICCWNEYKLPDEQINSKQNDKKNNQNLATQTIKLIKLKKNKISVEYQEN